MKAPTKHGLDRKFKSWRRGKSQKANKRSSLKQQLRGHQRLLNKLPEDSDKEKREELKAKMKVLEVEIAQKQTSITEKKHAEQSHGQRFLDRQRLTRKEKAIRKSGGDNNSKELFSIALDQAYVAHHPNDVKYMPLFSKGQRVVDVSRQLFRRAVTRKRILKELASSKTQRLHWISSEQYERLPLDIDWTIQDEERVFGGTMSRQGLKDKKSLQTEDSRFSVATEHNAVLQAADQVDEDLNEETEKKEDDSSDNNSDSSDSETEQAKPITAKTKAKDDSNSDSDSSEDDDDADPLKKKTPQKVSKPIQSKSQQKEDSSDSSSSSDDSDSDDDDEKEPQKKELSKKDDSSSDSSSSSDSNNTSEDEEDEKPKKAVEPEPKEPEEEEDDFLMDAADDKDTTDVFQKTTAQLPAMGLYRGDKSKGWGTQQQRPGEFKKRRVR
jgi:hypothetical protein